MWDYPEEIPTITVGPIVIDTEHHRVTIHGAPVHLSPMQFRLLSALAHANGRILTRDWLIANVWEDMPETQQPLEFALSKLRRQLGSERWRIQSIAKVGVRMEHGVL